MWKALWAVIAIVVVVTSNPAEAKKRPQLTPMELQAIQSREFETDKDSLFNAVMTVVQDLGYQVESADIQTGFITAYSATENKTNFFEALGGMQSSGQTKMTAFIQKLPNGRAKVRLNFLNTRTSSSAYGRNSQQDKPILDATVYQVAWDKIDEALFVIDAMEKSAPEPQATTAGVSAPSQPVLQGASSPLSSDNDASPQPQ